MMDTAIILTMKINFENFDLMALFAWRVTIMATPPDESFAPLYIQYVTSVVCINLLHVAHYSTQPLNHVKRIIQ